MSALLDSLLQGFEALPAPDAAGLGPARRAALAALRAEGLPPARAEAWKYTSLRALERRAFASAASVPNFDATALALPPAPRLVFANGIYLAALSDTAGLPDGVTLEPLSGLLAEGEARDVEFLARRFAGRDEAFARANAALASEGMVLRVAAGVVVPQPLHLLLLGVPEADRAWHLRHLVEMREGAQLTLVEQRLATGAHAHLANELVQVHLARGAHLVHARLQQDADGASLLLRTDAVLAAGADYRRLDLELGAALSRHELNVSLQGEGAALAANGVLLASGRRHLDTRLGIEHVARDTRCDLSWRGLGAGRGRAVFHGGIVIRAGADGSAAQLANKNLLLSEGAEIDTQPVLEIHADEVQAAHGATVGRLDPDALFYLRSRGLGAAEARALLTAAFCREVLGLLDDPALRELLVTRLDPALAALDAA
jgi:Fe-S cluster assembly protein SufD